MSSRPRAGTQRLSDHRTGNRTGKRKTENGKRKTPPYLNETTNRQNDETTKSPLAPPFQIGYKTAGSTKTTIKRGRRAWR